MDSKVKRLVRMFVSTGLDYENRLRIYEQGVDVVVERETLIGAGREGEVSFTLVYADTASRIEEWISNDPDDSLSIRGSEFLAGRSQCRSIKRDDLSADQIQTLAGITSDAELSRTIPALINPLGAQAFIAMYGSFDPQTHQPRTHVALTAGDNGFLQLYVQKRWFAIDPFLTHAVASNTPIYSSTIGLLENLTGSWRDMGIAARDRGLCSWAGFPTHRPRTNDFGVLYIASPTLPAEGGECPFQEKAVYLRGLAAEIFDWQLAARRAQDLNDRHFDSRDLRVLKAVAAGNTARDIASALEISERDVLKRVFPQVVAKARTRNIRDAARYAADRGLLPTLDGRKVVHVAVSDIHGIYLEHFSAYRSGRQTIRLVFVRLLLFATETDAREILSNAGIGDGYRFVRVEVDQSADTVAEEICIAFGLPGWNDRNVSTSGAPADNSSMPGALEDSPAAYH